ncbi:hypothetical protein QWY81_07235 [Polaribacter undariae]|uniref:Uncharacterized protein n=1 Tax=Polaribacter sejongensis TaxID=985043 RepID=A0AAJ1VGG9_9FLAO|nr:hypothetical protein [Polaribacter undariae]MDN3619244.1 hypothetical protein [Polaribacter undariae]UWD33555.1 hypothetical protein NQP51_07735 [Polaribacter undariae]
MNLLVNITTADWINIIIASITLLTAIIALLTINEMRKQRVHSYFPDLNMANFSFYVYKRDNDDEIKSINLHYYKKRKKKKEKIDGFNELKIGINNIGFGVAKNVNWTWGFDFEQAKKIICKDKSVKWEKKGNNIIIESKKANIEWAFDIYQDSIGGNFNFILPFSNENRKTEIVIPYYFINLYWLHMITKIGKKGIKSIEDYFPNLELNVKYTDIHSNEIEKTFLIKINIQMIAVVQENTKTLAKFRFEISEK